MKNKVQEKTSRVIYAVMIGGFVIVGLISLAKEKVLDKIIYR